MKKALAVLAVSVFMTGNILAANVGDQTLAVVNGEPVFTSEFNEVVVPVLEQYKQNVPQAQQSVERENEIKNAVLNQKIEEALLKQEVKKQKIKITKKEIQEGVDQIKKRFANESEFTAELKKENLSISDFEKRLSDQMAVMKLVRQSVESRVKIPTDDQVKAFYDQVLIKIKGAKTNLSPAEDELAANLANFLKRAGGEQVRLRQIFIASPKGASAADAKAAQTRVDAVKKALASGEDFATVAGQLSEDANSKAKNGDVGIVAKGDLQPDIDKVVFGSLKVGDYTKNPVKTDNGFHFLKVEEKRAARDITFDEVKNDIRELLYQNEAKIAYAAWINDLKSKANIKINKAW